MNDVLDDSLVRNTVTETATGTAKKRRRSDSSDGEIRDVDLPKRTKANEEHQDLENDTDGRNNQIGITESLAEARRGNGNLAAAHVTAVESAAPVFSSTAINQNNNSNASARSLPSVGALRIPSKQTPGRIRETVNMPRYSDTDASSIEKPFDSNRRVGLFLETPNKERKPTPDSRSIHEQGVEELVSQQSGNELPVPKDASWATWARKAHQCASDYVSSIHSQVFGLCQRLMAENKDPIWSALDHFRHPSLWFFILILPHMYYYKFCFSTLASTSDLGKSLFKKTDAGPYRYSKNTSEAPNEIRFLKKLMEELKSATASLSQDKESLASDISRSFHLLSDELAPQVSSLGSNELPAMIEMLEDSNAELSDLLKDGASFAESSSKAHLTRRKSDLINVSMLELGDIDDLESNSCGHGHIALNSNNNSQYITKTQFGQSIAELNEYLRNKIKMVNNSNDEGALHSWIYDVTHRILSREYNEMKEKSHDSSLQNGNERLRNSIKTRLENENADRTGLVDYASIANGASVIRSGPAATSKSLSEKVPYLNRLAHHLALRFYGHGPEAALTPTHPISALGQCWSFEKESNALSGFGTLTVRLARPLNVEKISIEHPTLEFTDNQSSAIRSFRIVGFEDFDALSSKGHSLGSFEFQIGENSSGLQTFDVLTCGSKLKSISLAIDTTWGAPYACLYRFRVHGIE